MLLTTLVLHLLLGRYMVAAEVGARAATKSMANGGRNSVWISASGSLGTVSVGGAATRRAARLVHVLVFWYRLRENSSDLGHFILAP